MSLLLSAIGIAMIVLMPVYNCVSIPAEDAVILHQYSWNLANSGIISYIPGGPVAEGATDFLWMLYLALGIKMHISIAIMTAIANVATAWGIAIVLLRIAGARFKITAVLAVIGVLSLFPQMQAALKGFCVLPFGLAIALEVMFLNEENDVGGALSALLLCLIRPDGVVFAVPLLILRLISTQQRTRTFRIISLIYILPGLAYFVWRWLYFKQMFPLPFLVKSSADRTLGVFIPNSVKSLLPYVFYAAVVLILVMGKRLFVWKEVRYVLALLIIPIFFYSNISLQQNLDARFFFFIPLGIGLMVAMFWTIPWQFKRNTVFIAAFCFYLVLFSASAAKGLASNLYGISEYKRIKSLASDLNAIQPHGVLLTSEAGLVPYFSRWPSYDTWGLNTVEFARQVIQPSQITELNPDLIELHQTGIPCTSELKVLPPRLKRTWNNMSENVKSGLAVHPELYEIWRVPYWSAAKERRLIARKEGEDDVCWYVSRSFSGRADLDRILNRYGGVEIDSSMKRK